MGYGIVAPRWTRFCGNVLISRRGPRAVRTLPERITLVSDNGPQFVSRRFRQWLASDDNPFVHVRGRSHHPQTTGMVERYHQSLKYEEIRLNEYSDPLEARRRIALYRLNYAYRRPHQALDYDVPSSRYLTSKSGDLLRETA